MVQEQESKEPRTWRRRLRRLFALSIRGKIILPYLILTLVVAVVGTYVVTNLVATSLDERLTNHLLEAGRVVSESLARQDLSHVNAARIVAFTDGVAEAIQADDGARVEELAKPAAAGLGVEALVLVDADGREMLHLLYRENSLDTVAEDSGAAQLWMVQALLESNDPDARPERGLGIHPVNERYYYFTAIPIPLEGDVVGVAVVGTSLDTLLPHFESASLANLIIYETGGEAIATTFAVPGQELETEALLEKLSISPAAYQEALHSDESTIVERVRVRERWYRLARGPLMVGDTKLGVFAVTLPLNFVLRPGVQSRNTYALLFSLTMGGVILIGYLISQRITIPLGALVRTSQAVAEGDLEQRTGVGSRDEIGVLATTFDQMTERLAERTRALEELLEAQKEAAGRMQAILSSIGDGVVLEDMDGNFIPLNATAEAMVEEMATDFLNSPLRELAVGEDEDLDARSSPWLLESRRFQVANKILSIHAAAVRTEDGRRLGNVIVLRDVTAEVEAERLKDAFITHVSHELRTPLTAIKGYTDLLLAGARGQLDEKQASFLETISRHTDSLKEMVNELLDLSEVEAGRELGLQREPLTLSSLVEKIADRWRPQMEEKGLEFEVNVPTDLPLVNADARRMRWAIINLVRNAWQNTPSGGRVTLRLSSKNGRVLIDVEDTGVGIPPGERQQIFERFYRIQRESENETRGLGLGLYITRAIVEAHDGEIHLDSQEGVGSTFSLVLPVIEPGEEDEEID